jgi:hypothetical protein
MEPSRSQSPRMLVVRYRGFVLLPHGDGWVVRPERSPMRILPFRVDAADLDAVKLRVDERLVGRRLSGMDQARAA